MLKTKFYAIFMLQSRIKIPERNIEPRGCFQVDTVYQITESAIQNFKAAPADLVCLRVHVLLTRLIYCTKCSRLFSYKKHWVKTSLNTPFRPIWSKISCILEQNMDFLTNFNAFHYDYSDKPNQSTVAAWKKNVEET